MEYKARTSNIKKRRSVGCKKNSNINYTQAETPKAEKHDNNNYKQFKW